MLCNQCISIRILKISYGVRSVFRMNICKLPDPLSFTGNNAKNWCDFKEHLQWFLAGTESTEKSDMIKIGKNRHNVITCWQRSKRSV